MSSSDKCNFGTLKFTNTHVGLCDKEATFYFWSPTHNEARGVCNKHLLMFGNHKKFKTKEEAELYGLNLKLFGEGNG